MNKKPAEKCTQIKKDGVRCGNYPRKGRTKCGKHGGATPRGANSPHFKNGRYSKYTSSVDELKHVASEMDNPELLSIRPEIAVMSSQLMSIIENMNKGVKWDDMIAAWESFTTAVSQKDGNAQRSAIASIDEIVAGARDNVAALNKFEHIANVKSRFIGDHFKSNLMARQLVHIDQLIVMRDLSIHALRETLLDAVGNNEIDKQVAVNITKKYGAALREMQVQPTRH